MRLVRIKAKLASLPYHLRKIPSGLYKNRITILRHICQFASLILIYAAFVQIQASWIPLPVLACLGTTSRRIACGIGVIFWALSHNIVPIVSVGILLTLGALLGRTFCGWVCPFGLVQDIAGYVKRKHYPITPKGDRELSYIRFALLAVALLLSLSLFIAHFTSPATETTYRRAFRLADDSLVCLLCPASPFFVSLPPLLYQLATAIPAAIKGLPAAWPTVPRDPLFWFRIGLLAAILWASVELPRFWCKYLCPLGALLHLIGRHSLLGIRCDRSRCLRCGICARSCPMRLRPFAAPEPVFTDGDCIYCLRCVERCPESALKLRFG